MIVGWPAVLVEVGQHPLAQHRQLPGIQHPAWRTRSASTCARCCVPMRAGMRASTDRITATSAAPIACSATAVAVSGSRGASGAPRPASGQHVSRGVDPGPCFTAWHTGDSAHQLHSRVITSRGGDASGIDFPRRPTTFSPGGVQLGLQRTQLIEQLDITALPHWWAHRRRRHSLTIEQTADNLVPPSDALGGNRGINCSWPPRSSGSCSSPNRPRKAVSRERSCCRAAA